ncbi:hypothetical protein B4113_0778 [Geobacillus sp. B4113_201601]|nr:hypothetical protein B4113_0778 [Geobacillus sp. B4113_201601]
MFDCGRTRLDAKPAFLCGDGRIFLFASTMRWCKIKNKGEPLAQAAVRGWAAKMIKGRLYAVSDE